MLERHRMCWKVQRQDVDSLHLQYQCRPGVKRMFFIVLWKEALQWSVNFNFRNGKAKIPSGG